jgi:Uma2 family endonuclease
MKARAEATIEDLYRESGKAELVDGDILHMSPTGKLPNYAAGEIFVSLRQYARETRAGYAATDNLGFVVDLPRRKSFSPDVSFYTGTVDMDFVQGAPLFAVEVRSAGDYGPAAERAMAAKRRDYFDAGTLVVWDVDVLHEGIVRVYRAAEPTGPAVYGRGEVAEAEPALPGWKMPVDDLFPT